MFLPETETESKRSSPRGYGYSLIPFPPFLGILDMHAHVLSVSVKLPSLELKSSEL